MTGEPIGAEHEAEVFGLLSDAEVWPTLSRHLREPDADELADNLAHTVSHWERHGFGLWLLRDCATAAVVGRGGLQSTDTPVAGTVEVAWAIAPERRREGLATELALASLDIAFASLGLREVVAMTLPHNVASRRVMEKARFVYSGEVEHAGMPHVLYRRRRD